MHRKGGVHDMAFTNGRGPRLHHVAFWVPTPLNIIDLLDLMATTGYLANIERGPGRHGLSNASFLHIRDPARHSIAIYCSAYQPVDPELVSSEECRGGKACVRTFRIQWDADP